MKIFKSFFLMLTAIAVVSLSSCSKSDDEDTTPENPLSNGLKVDGSSWDASLAVQAVNTSGVINVTGSDSNGKQAGVILYGVTEPGTYNVQAGLQHQLRWTEGLDASQTYVANGILGSGSITITELSSSKVKGTFQFTGANTAQATKSITEGSFEASF
jgi:hypothetical protein